MNTKTKNTTNIPPPTAEETRLQGIAGELGNEQLSAIQGYAPYREMLFSMIPGLGRSISRDLGIRGAEFRNITQEEKDYRQFQNTRPGGGSGARVFNEDEFRTGGLDTRKQERISTLGDSIGGVKSYYGKKGRKRARQAAAANAESSAVYEAQKKQEMAVWQAQSDALKAKADAARGVQPSQGLGLDGMDDQDAYDYGFSPYERDLVNELADEQYELGSSDINRAYKESLGTLSQELAPGRGLRGYDSPILDRGGKLADETIRQRSQLSRGLRAQSSQQLLGISEQAKANRQSLLGFLGNQGLGLGTGDVNQTLGGLRQGRLGQAGGTGSKSGLGAGEYGSIASGVGSLIAASSRELKDVGTKVSGEGILMKLRSLTMYKWNYKGETVQHIGPMAEDFLATFGVGDGKTLALVDVMGVLLASMQGLEARHG